jgi:hypothetical protein
LHGCIRSCRISSREQASPFSNYIQNLNFWLRVKFGKKHLNLITINIIRWYWRQVEWVVFTFRYKNSKT